MTAPSAFVAQTDGLRCYRKCRVFSITLRHNLACSSCTQGPPSVQLFHMGHTWPMPRVLKLSTIDCRSSTLVPPSMRTLRQLQAPTRRTREWAGLSQVNCIQLKRPCHLQQQLSQTVCKPKLRHQRACLSHVPIWATQQVVNEVQCSCGG